MMCIIPWESGLPPPAPPWLQDCPPKLLPQKSPRRYLLLTSNRRSLPFWTWPASCSAWRRTQVKLSKKVTKSQALPSNNKTYTQAVENLILIWRIWQVKLNNYIYLYYQSELHMDLTYILNAKLQSIKRCLKYAHPGHLPEDAVIMSSTGYRRIRRADGEIYIRLTRLCINWLWFCHKCKHIMYITTPHPMETCNQKKTRSERIKLNPYPIWNKYLFCNKLLLFLRCSDI